MPESSLQTLSVQLASSFVAITFIFTLFSFWSVCRHHLEWSWESSNVTLPPHFPVAPQCPICALCLILQGLAALVLDDLSNFGLEWKAPWCSSKHPLSMLCFRCPGVTLLKQVVLPTLVHTHGVKSSESSGVCCSFPHPCFILTLSCRGLKFSTDTRMLSETKAATPFYFPGDPASHLYSK